MVFPLPVPPDTMMVHPGQDARDHELQHARSHVPEPDEIPRRQRHLRELADRRTGPRSERGGMIAWAGRVTPFFQTGNSVFLPQLHQQQPDPRAVITAADEALINFLL